MLARKSKNKYPSNKFCIAPIKKSSERLRTANAKELKNKKPKTKVQRKLQIVRLKLKPNKELCGGYFHKTQIVKPKTSGANNTQTATN